jgi:hypothetical protein
MRGIHLPDDFKQIDKTFRLHRRFEVGPHRFIVQA